MSKQSAQEHRKTIPHDADLTWYFCEAESASGVACPLGALMSDTPRQSGGTPQADRKMTDWRVGWPGRKEAQGKPEDVKRERAKEAYIPSAVTRARAIRTRLLSLPQKYQDVLWLAYGPHVWPMQLASLRSTAGVTLVTDAARIRYKKAILLAGAPPAQAEATSAARAALGGWILSAVVLSTHEGVSIGPDLPVRARRERENLNIAIARAKEDVPAIVQEAEALVSAAVAAWKATAPKARRKAPRQFVYREGTKET